MSAKPLKPKQEVIDTIRLTDDEVNCLHEALDSEDVSPAAANRRRKPRVPYRRSPRLVLDIKNQGVLTRHRVIPRNISGHGFGLLIGTFLYNGTRCSLNVLTVDNSLRKIDGAVVRCQHIKGRLHEIGIEFNEIISLEDLIGKRIDPNATTEALNLPRLIGSVLYVESNADDRDLLRFLLNRMGLRMTAISNAEDIAGFVEKIDFDVIVVNLDMIDQQKIDPGVAVRRAGFHRLLIGLTCDESQARVDHGLLNGCEHVLVKPGGFDALCSLLTEVLPHWSGREKADAGTPLVSSRWHIAAMQPVILKFLKRVQERMGPLVELVKQPTAREEAVRALRELKGSAAGFGYQPISEAAGALIQELHENATESIENVLDELKLLCQRACEPHRQQIAAV